MITSKKNKHVHIFGASRGIGREIALHLSSLGGYDLYLYSRSAMNLIELKKVIKYKFDSNCVITNIDIRNISKLKKIITNTKEADIIINNASINIIKKFNFFNINDFNKMMETNFRSFFFICQFFINKFYKKKKLNIINISSIMGKVAQPIDSDRPQTMYICMKHAIEGLTKALCTEFPSGNLKINSICPTYVMTEMVANTLRDKKKLKKIISKMPSKKLASTSDVAKLVAFLCSDESTMINGSSVMLDGGWTAH